MTEIIISNPKIFEDFRVSIPEESLHEFEIFMLKKGWKYCHIGSHKNKPIVINLDEVIRADK